MAIAYWKSPSKLLAGCSQPFSCTLCNPGTCRVTWHAVCRNIPSGGDKCEVWRSVSLAKSPLSRTHVYLCSKWTETWEGWLHSISSPVFTPVRLQFCSQPSCHHSLLPHEFTNYGADCPDLGRCMQKEREGIKTISNGFTGNYSGYYSWFKATSLKHWKRWDTGQN